MDLVCLRWTWLYVGLALRWRRSNCGSPRPRKIAPKVVNFTKRPHVMRSKQCIGTNPLLLCGENEIWIDHILWYPIRHMTGHITSVHGRGWPLVSHVIRWAMIDVKRRGHTIFSQFVKENRILCFYACMLVLIIALVMIFNIYLCDISNALAQQN